MIRFLLRELLNDQTRKIDDRRRNSMMRFNRIYRDDRLRDTHPVVDELKDLFREVLWELEDLDGRRRRR